MKKLKFIYQAGDKVTTKYGVEGTVTGVYLTGRNMEIIKYDITYFTGDQVRSGYFHDFELKIDKSPGHAVEIGFGK